MKIHRFYISDLKIKGAHRATIQDAATLHQWRSVLRFRAGQQVVLFNSSGDEALLEIERLSKDKALLRVVEERSALSPRHATYLFWSLLKKDKNEWILQKATELGVTHFVPIIARRCEAADVSRLRADRWQKIIVEAAEQCGRSDIPTVLSEPMELTDALSQYANKVSIRVAEQDLAADQSDSWTDEPPVGVLIGPEGGWEAEEKALFDSHNLPGINLGQFVLRAETAAIIASAKMVQYEQ